MGQKAKTYALKIKSEKTNLVFEFRRKQQNKKSHGISTIHILYACVSHNLHLINHSDLPSIVQSMLILKLL